VMMNQLPTKIQQ